MAHERVEGGDRVECDGQEAMSRDIDARLTAGMVSGAEGRDGHWDEHDAIDDGQGPSSRGWKPSRGLGLGTPTRYSIGTASRVVSQPLFERSFSSGASSSILTFDDTPDFMHSHIGGSPESPESTRGGFADAVTSSVFFDDKSDDLSPLRGRTTIFDPSSLLHSTFSNSSPLPFARQHSPSSPPDRHLHQPAAFDDVNLRSSFSSTSSYASSNGTTSTSASDNPFLFRPPPLPLAPSRPERPVYGTGTLPPLPTPLVRSPPVEFKDFGLEGVGTTWLGGRSSDRVQRSAANADGDIRETDEHHTLPMNPSQVAFSATDEYVFAPCRPSPSTPPSANTGTSKPTTAVRISQSTAQGPRDRSLSVFSDFSGASEGGQFSDAGDEASSFASVASSFASVASSPESEMSVKTAFFAHGPPSSDDGSPSGSRSGTGSRKEEELEPVTPRPALRASFASDPFAPPPPTFNLAPSADTPKATSVPNLPLSTTSNPPPSTKASPPSASCTLQLVLTRDPTTAFEAYAFSPTPTIGTPTSNPSPHPIAIPPAREGYAFPAVSAAGSFVSSAPSNERKWREKEAKVGSQSPHEELLELYQGLSPLERFPPRKGAEEGAKEEGLVGLAIGIDERPTPEPEPTAPQPPAAAVYASGPSTHPPLDLTIPRAPDPPSHPSSPEKLDDDDEEDTVPRSAFDGLRERASVFATRVRELEWELKMAKINVDEARRGWYNYDEDGFEVEPPARKFKKIDALLAEMGIDVNVSTPILLSPGFATLPACPHCHRQIRPRTYRPPEEGNKHLDVWRTEHWACLPHITDIIALAQS